MEKQLKTELKELASKILANDSLTDINVLKKQAANLYECLTVLDYTINKPIESEINTTITPETVETTNDIDKTIPESQNIETEIIEKNTIEVKLSSEKKIESFKEKEIVVKEKNTTDTAINTPNLLHELEELTAGFDLPEFEPVISTVNSVQKPKSSLNNSLNKGILFGLNDRLAFVKHLFNDNSDDFTRVISQLNTIEDKESAKKFILNIVKPEYQNWEDKEAYEERFITAVFRKFED